MRKLTLKASGGSGFAGGRGLAARRLPGRCVICAVAGRGQSEGCLSYPVATLPPDETPACGPHHQHVHKHKLFGAALQVCPYLKAAHESCQVGVAYSFRCWHPDRNRALPTGRSTLQIHTCACQVYQHCKQKQTACYLHFCVPAAEHHLQEHAMQRKGVIGLQNVLRQIPPDLPMPPQVTDPQMR